MGITGLLPALRPVTRDVHLKELSGLRVGVDTYCWLHKAVYTCPEELCTGVPTDKHIKFALSRLDMLLHFGLKPYLVFDGDYLPAKGGKEKERAEKREESRKRAEQCLREGDTAGARAHFIKAVDVTPAMAAQFIAAARSRGGARFVVAPYEADAQLGYLCRSGQIDLVITEDSDLLLFGCTRVLFKLGKDAAGQQVTLHEVFTERNDELDFRRCASTSASSSGGGSSSGGHSGSDGDECGGSGGGGGGGGGGSSGGSGGGSGGGGGGGSSAAAEDALLLTCALSGCDYLPSVLGIGLKRAHRFATKHGDIARTMRAIRFEFGSTVPADYEVALRRAMATFRHQRVFDPVSRTVVHLTPLPEDHALGEDLSFLGPPVPDAQARAIADGIMDPVTRKLFPSEVFQPAHRPPATPSGGPARGQTRGGGGAKGGGGAWAVKSIPASLTGQRTINKFFAPAPAPLVVYAGAAAPSQAVPRKLLAPRHTATTPWTASKARKGKQRTDPPAASPASHSFFYSLGSPAGVAAAAAAATDDAQRGSGGAAAAADSALHWLHSMAPLLPMATEGTAAAAMDDKENNGAAPLPPPFVVSAPASKFFGGTGGGGSSDGAAQSAVKGGLKPSRAALSRVKRRRTLGAAAAPPSTLIRRFFSEPQSTTGAAGRAAGAASASAAVTGLQGGAGRERKVRSLGGGVRGARQRTQCGGGSGGGGNGGGGDLFGSFAFLADCDSGGALNGSGGGGGGGGGSGGGGVGRCSSAGGHCGDADAPMAKRDALLDVLADVSMEEDHDSEPEPARCAPSRLPSGKCVDASWSAATAALTPSPARAVALDLSPALQPCALPPPSLACSSGDRLLHVAAALPCAAPVLSVANASASGYQDMFQQFVYSPS